MPYLVHDMDLVADENVFITTFRNVPFTGLSTYGNSPRSIVLMILFMIVL